MCDRRALLLDCCAFAGGEVPSTAVTTKPHVARLFGRALLLRCPRCGGGGLLRGWLKMQDRCPTCGLALERGEKSDFWIGAYVFNLAAGELIAIGVPIIWVIKTSPNTPWNRVEILAI